MKILLSIILFNASLITFGQNEQKSSALQDSLNKIMNENITPPVKVKPELVLPLSPVTNFSLSLKLGLNPFIPEPEIMSDLNNDLYFSQSLLKEKFKSSFLYTMLGAMQTGAVGFMAYKHIKKFGLFK